MDPEQTLPTVIPHSISLVACAYLFYCYSTIPKKTIGVKMIFIISLSDFVFHVSALILFFCFHLGDSSFIKGLKEITTFIAECSLIFSTLWACNIAFFLCQLLRMKQISNPATYLNYSLRVMLILTVTLGVLDIFATAILKPILFTILAICLVLVVLFYCRSICILRSHSDLMRDAIQVRTKDLFIYALLPFFTFGSLWLGSLSSISNSATISTIQHILVGLLGFMNSLVFFFQRMRSQEKDRAATAFFDNAIDDYSGRDSIQGMLFAEAHNTY